MSDSAVMSNLQVAVGLAAGLVEAFGVLTILLGVALTFPGAIRSALWNMDHGQQHQRRRLGRSLLLGLEFLVAADVIRSVAIAPTLQGVAVLALLVAVRTFLNWTLELELDGRWPWQRGPAADTHPPPTDAEATRSR